ncbi:MAG: hypothetical protein WC822_06755 [Candidatus Paceibacterota bacterium]|jgi:hypothetical protein
MASTDPQLYTLARSLGDKAFVQPNHTGHSDLDELKAAMGKIDQAFGSTTNQIQALYPATNLRTAMLAHIKTGAPNLTNAEAGMALALWALHEAGLL